MSLSRTAFLGVPTLMGSLFTAFILGSVSGGSLTSLQFSPSSADVSTQAESVTAAVGVTSSVGLSYGTVTLFSPAGERTLTSVFSSYDRISGTGTDGIYAANVQIPRYCTPGNWQVMIDLYENGTQSSFGGPFGGPPMPAGLPETFAIQNTGAVDTANPALVSLSFSPSPVDVSATMQVVTITASATDDLAGISSGSLTLRSPSGAKLIYGYFSSVERTGGTALNGSYTFSMQIPRYVEPGAWTADLHLSDAAGRSLSYGSGYEPYPSGSTGLLDVVNTAGVDMGGPVMTGLQINPGSVDVSAAPQQVTVSFHITDDVGGFDYGFCDLTSPSGSHRATKKFNFEQRTAGTATAGDYSFVMTIPRYVEGGTWKIELTLQDAAGNYKSYGGYNGPLPQSLAVANSGAVDSSPPAITGLTVSPSQVNATGAPAQVTVTMQIADTPAGLLAGRVGFYGPNSGPYAESGTDFTTAQLVSGSATNGSYQAVFTIPQGAALGEWKIGLSLNDAAGNSKSYGHGYYADPLPAGLSGVVTVVQDAVASTYSNWSAGAFPSNVPLADRTSSADPDQDGVTNLEEYAFNLNPTANSQSGLPTLGKFMASPSGLEYLTLSYRRWITLRDVTYDLASSTQFGTWDAMAGNFEQVGSPVPVGDGQTETVRFRCKIAISDSSKRFLRLEIRKP